MATYDSEPQPVEPTPDSGTAARVEQYMRELRALHAGVVPPIDPTEQRAESIPIANDAWSQPSEDDRPGSLQERLNRLGDNTIGAILLWFYNNL